MVGSFLPDGMGWEKAPLTATVSKLQTTEVHSSKKITCGKAPLNATPVIHYFSPGFKWIFGQVSPELDHVLIFVSTNLKYAFFF